MFPKKLTNCSRMPFAPGSKTRLRAAVRMEARDIDLDGLIRYSPILRMPCLISIFLVCFLSAGTVLARQWNSEKDNSDGKSSPVLPVGSCQPSNAMSLLAADRQVFSFVPKGSWLVPQKDIGLVSVEPYAVPLKRIPTAKPVTSCASNSRTGQTVCTTNDKDVYVFTPPALSPSTLQSGASGTSTFFGGTCMTCAATMDAVHNKALLSLSLLVPPSSGAPALGTSTATSGFQYIDLGENPNPETAFRSEAPPAFNPGGEISKGILVDPVRNWILSPNESGNFEIIKVVSPKDNNEDNDRHDETANDDHGDKGDNKGDDKGSGKTQLAFFENNPTNNPGINDPSSSPPMPASFASAGEECRTGIAVATVEFSDPSEVYLVDLAHVGFSPGSPGSWPTPSTRSASTNYQSLEGSSFPDTGPNGVAVAQGTSIGVLAGMKSNSITAFKLPESVPGKPPVIDRKDYVTCGIPGMTGVAPHTLNAYQSPNTGHAMATVGNLDATVLWRVDLTEMLKLPSTGNICNSVSLPPGVLHAIAVP